MSLFKRNDFEAKIPAELLEAEDVGEIVFDRYGVIHYVNKAAVRLTGYSSAAAMIGGNLFDVVTLKDRNGESTTSAQNKIVNAAKTVTRLRLRSFSIVSAKGGASVPIELTLIPFLCGSEQLFLLKMRDLTEDLERDSAQAEFIATASHEMRTPLAAIQGYLGLALNPRIMQIDTRARETLEQAQDASVRLGELFKNLLDVSRLDDGRMAPKMEKIGINSFIRKYENDFEMLAKKKQQQFELRLNPTEVFCNLDFTFFQDIVSNLVENAVKYTPEGGKIILKTLVDDNVVRISVKDNGAGINNNDLSYIFNKFFRSPNTKLQTGGTGLGLYLVKQRTEMMDGRIEVQSEIGKGSVFTVIFPIVLEDKKQESYDEKIANQHLVVEEIKPIEREELMEADPLSHIENDSKLPIFIEEIGSRPFIKMSEQWRNGEIPDASEEDKKLIYDDIRRVNSQVPIEQFNNVWAKFEPRLNNPGLTGMMKKTMGTPDSFASQFVIPWMLISPSAASWEFGFGFGYDFEGKWREFPHNDRAYLTAHRDPVFSWVRERAILARKEIANKDSVLFLYAGVLPELRDVSYYQMPKEVWACDDDVSLNTKDIFGWSTAAHNVFYDIMKAPDYIEKAIANGKTFDTIVMNGASLSHYGELEGVIESSIKVLKPGGKIMFDIQLEHWDLVRAWFVFGVVPDSAPSLTNLKGAVEKVRRLCERLPNVRLEYAVDSRSKPPTAVMFYITNEL